VAETPRRSPSILEQLGGVSGLVSSTVPVVVFVVVNVVSSMQPALVAAIASAAAITIWRLVRREALQPAISGLIGVGICAFIANQTGEARGFFLPGILLSAALCAVFLGSVLVRWPLAGVVWHGINGDGQGWRRDPRLLRAYALATLLWAAVFGAKFVVQGYLYTADDTTWLAVARIAMGYPLAAVALLATIWAVRRARQAIAADTATAEAA
jgi:hypothetical protein